MGSYVLQRLSEIGIAPHNRALAWILLILLTVVLLLFPVHLTHEYHPIQAPYLFEKLPLFGILFCIWMLLIFFLLFSKRDEGSGLDWENLALISTFGLVFLGFWVVITPLGSFTDGIFNMGHVRWLLDEGSIPIGHTNLIYFDFPGMHLLVTALAQVTNLGVFESRTFFLIINAVIFCALLYVLFVKLMKSGRLAFLGVLLAVLGSVLIVDDITTFYPRALAFAMLAGFLVMLTRSETKLFGTTMSDRLLMLILFVAMTVSYFATPLLAPLILLGIYAIQILGRDMQARISWRTIILFFSIVIIWEIYWTWHNFYILAKFLPQAWDAMLAGEFLKSAITMGQANIGGGLPLWATITRSFWWALIGFCTILGLRNLFRVKELSLAEKIVTGGLVGVILLTLIGTFGTEGGQQFSRFLLYGPLFCVPILLMFLYKSRAWRVRGLTVVTVLVFILALPTFLSSVNTVATDAIYPYEVSAGEFVESHSGEKGKDYIVYNLTSGSRAWAYYYIPDTSFRNPIEMTYYRGNEAEAWQEVDDLVAEYKHRWVLPGTQKIFVTNEKNTALFQHLLDVPSDDPRWGELTRMLSSTNRIFDDGHMQMYMTK